MKVTSTSGKGNFKIEKNNKTVLELKYKNWFSSSALTEFNNTPIEIKAKNIWGNKFDIYKNKIDKGDIIFNWKGDVIIRLTDSDNNEQLWLLKSKGLLKQTFQLSNENGELMIVFKSSMNWSKFNFNYEIEFLNEDLKDSELIELILYSCYGINLYFTMVAGGFM